MNHDSPSDKIIRLLRAHGPAAAATPPPQTITAHSIGVVTTGAVTIATQQVGGPAPAERTDD